MDLFLPADPRVSKMLRNKASQVERSLRDAYDPKISVIYPDDKPEK